jgi:large subunit ribosomal protein L10
MKIAIEQSAKEIKGLEKLIPFLKGMPALLFTKENPFGLYKTIQKNKSNAPIKAGQTAPKDIIVPAGPTSFAPGPIIGQLGAVGISAGIDKGKVIVKKDSKVAKAGDIIKAELAGILTRLGIEPLEIGLDITGVFENGEIYSKDVLSVDDAEYIRRFGQAYRWAFNLAIEAGVVNKSTIEFMITKAARQSRAVALEAAICEPEIMPDLLAKAYRQGICLENETK